MRRLKAPGGKRPFARAAAVAGLMLLACLERERQPLAADAARNLTVTCVADRPVAHPGEKISVTLWINGALGRAVVDIKWRASVGKIAGNSTATWTLPTDDAKVSIEAPATARASVRDETLETGECRLQVYFVHRVVRRGETAQPLLSGRTFLLSGKKEPEGYGLYSYILFGTPPRDDNERERYLKGLEAYLQVMQPIEELERYRDPHQLNITLVPLKAAIDLNRSFVKPDQARELAEKLLEIYDYSRAQVLLSDFGLNATTSGPVLVSKRLLTKASQADRTVFDMSRVESTLVWQWTKAFCNIATQEISWTEATLRRFALNVRNVIAVAANITPQVKGELDDLLLKPR